MTAAAPELVVDNADEKDPTVEFLNEVLAAYIASGTDLRTVAKFITSEEALWALVGLGKGHPLIDGWWMHPSFIAKLKELPLAEAIDLVADMSSVNKWTYRELDWDRWHFKLPVYLLEELIPVSGLEAFLGIFGADHPVDGAEHVRGLCAFLKDVFCPPAD